LPAQHVGRALPGAAQAGVQPAPQPLFSRLVAYGDMLVRDAVVLV
jgi:hypothetical protein